MIVISSGHGKIIRGASGYIDEVDEARRVVNRVGELLDVTTFHDDVSTSQSENLNRIVDFHNSQQRDLDVSVHFNAYETTNKAMGTECLYLTQDALAETVAANVSNAGGFLNRGAKERTDLFFLNKTHRPSILIEVCFVDSTADVNLYHAYFEPICAAISEAITGEEEPELPLPPKLVVEGKISTFGGPEDTGVAPEEGLALIEPPDLDEWWFDRLFLTLQPPDTTGLARRLNPDAFYIAMRWAEHGIEREEARRATFKITNPENGEFCYAQGSDFGPADWTGRVADLSPGVATALNLETDDIAIIEMV